MIVMETVTITSITIDVTVKVTVDEGAVLRMFIDDLYANPNIVEVVFCFVEGKSV